MKDPLQKALDFAAARGQEAEAFYKHWAQTAESEAVRVAFGELGAAEHGHWQLLAHVTPADLASGSRERAADLGISEWLVEVKARARLSLEEALIVAMKREEASARLYDRLSELGGETAVLFRSLANEERRHRKTIEAIYDEVVPKGT
jgi:rubrerythrin